MKDPEDEAWDELEAAIKMREASGWRKRQIENARRAQSIDEAFEEWLEGANLAERGVLREAFSAGWTAGVRNEWLKERND